MQKSKAYLDLDLDGIRLFLKIDDYVNCANKNDSIYARLFMLYRNVFRF